MHCKALGILWFWLCLISTTLVQAASIPLTWDYTQGPVLAVKFTVHGLQGNDCSLMSTYSVVGEVPVTTRTYTFTSATPGLQYCFFVRAVAVDGAKSDPSNIMWTTIVDMLPPPVQHFHGTGSVGMIALGWDPVTSPLVSTIRIYQMRGTDCTNPQNFTLLSSLPATATTFVVAGLTSGLPYCYLSRSVDAQGREGDPSAVAGPFSVFLSAPTGLRIGVGVTSQLEMPPAAPGRPPYVSRCNVLPGPSPCPQHVR